MIQKGEESAIHSLSTIDCCRYPRIFDIAANQNITRVSRVEVLATELNSELHQLRLIERLSSPEPSPA